MLEVTGQFFLGYSLIILAFSLSFSILYGSTAEYWSNFNQFFSATKNALAGYDNTVENDGFTPYAFYWFGDVMILLYLVITGIVCINMLIAMMGNAFNNMVDKQILKRQRAFAKGDIYFQTEKFLLPPPFNLIHLMILGTSFCCWEHGRFQRWEPKSHNDAYSICMLLKEMYMFYRKEEIEKSDVIEYDDSDDDEKRLEITNIKLHPFVNKFFISRRPKEKEFLQHYVDIAANRSRGSRAGSRAGSAPSTPPLPAFVTSSTTTTTRTVTSPTKKKDDEQVQLDEVIGEEEGADEGIGEANEGEEESDSVEVDDGNDTI